MISNTETLYVILGRRISLQSYILIELVEFWGGRGENWKFVVYLWRNEIGVFKVRPLGKGHRCDG